MYNNGVKEIKTMFKNIFGKKDKKVKDEKVTQSIEVTQPNSGGDSTKTIEVTSEIPNVVIEPVDNKEHIHDEHCKHDHKEMPDPPHLTNREAKYLKRARYDKILDKFNTAYVLKNNKTGQIVEIRAASSFHACNIIGWKPNRVTVIDKKAVGTEAQGTKEVNKEDVIAETTSSSNT